MENHTKNGSLPTAKEFKDEYVKKLNLSQKGSNFEPQMMIEFAKLHCKAKEEAILQKAKIKWIKRPEQKTSSLGDFGEDTPIIDKESITGAYPETSII